MCYALTNCHTSKHRIFLFIVLLTEFKVEHEFNDADGRRYSQNNHHNDEEPDVYLTVGMPQIIEAQPHVGSAVALHTTSFIAVETFSYTSFIIVVQDPTIYPDFETWLGRIYHNSAIHATACVGRVVEEAIILGFILIRRSIVLNIELIDLLGSEELFPCLLLLHFEAFLLCHFRLSRGFLFFCGF